MKSRLNQQIPTRSHRSLTRTENSQQKLEQKRLSQRMNSIPSRSNQQLQGDEWKTPNKRNKLDRIKTEMKDISDKVRTQSGKKLIGIFKRAHQITQNQSFLHKVSKQRTKALNNEVRSIFKAGRSEGINTITSADHLSPQNRHELQAELGKALTFQNNFHSPQVKYRTISYHSSLSKVYTPVDFKISAENRQTSRESKPYHDIEIPQISGPHQKSANFIKQPSEPTVAKNGQQIQDSHVNMPTLLQGQPSESSQPKISTIRKNFRVYQREGDWQQTQTTYKQQTKQLQQQKSEQNDLQQKNTVVKPHAPEQINLDQLQTIDPIEKRSPEPKDKAQRSNHPSVSMQSKRAPSNIKRDYGSFYGDMNVVDIEQISFANAMYDNKHQQIKQKEKNKIKTQKTQLQKVKQQGNPYLPLESNLKTREKQDQSIMILQANSQPKITIHKGPDSNNDAKIDAKRKSKQKVKQPDNEPSRPNKSGLKVEGKANLSSETIRQQPASMKSIKSDGKQEQRQRILTILNKISKMHSNFEMFGELATYFSKNSKSIKLTEESKPFLRNESLSWHFMVYLFFKYFYYMLLLFSKFYHISSEIVLIKKEQLKQLNDENQKWAQTLNKIEKSVKKNAKPNSYEDNFFQDPSALGELQSEVSVNRLITLYFLHEGNENQNQFSLYMLTLRTRIYKQVTSFIKSMNLTNILSQQSQIALIFRQSAYRVFNSTIILYQFHNPSQPQLTTFQNTEQLNQPLIGDFKKFYEKLTKQILIKK